MLESLTDKILGWGEQERDPRQRREQQKKRKRESAVMRVSKSRRTSLRFKVELVWQIFVIEMTVLGLALLLQAHVQTTGQCSSREGK